MSNYTSDFYDGQFCSKIDHQGSEKSLLGIATELPSPPLIKNPEFVDTETGEIVTQGIGCVEDLKKHARRTRYFLQQKSSEILLNFSAEKKVNARGYEIHHRTCNCSRYRVADTVQILKSKQHKKSFYAGLMSCANARTCPVCAAPINERKAAEMRVAANMSDSLDLKLSMMTFTAPHTAGDEIDDLTKKISKALSYFFSGKAGDSFKSRYGIVGYIRSFEVRYGKNGWHPHFHLIVFQKKSSPSLPKTQRTKKRFLKKNQLPAFDAIIQRWQRLCVSAGLDCPNQYGLDIQDGSQAGEYITKFGSDGEILKTGAGKKITWDLADEMTKGNTKKGHDDSLSPWDLLSIASDSDIDSKTQKKHASLFLDYARAMAGKSQIKWSRGLRDMFDLKEELTDEEILLEQSDNASLLSHITPSEWNEIVKLKIRHIPLDVVDNGGIDGLSRFLHALKCNKSTKFSDFYRSFVNRSDSHNIDTSTDIDLSEPNFFGSFELTSIDQQVSVLLTADKKQLPTSNFHSFSNIVDNVISECQKDNLDLFGNIIELTWPSTEKS